jgi:methyl-accepting chemotaxis protein
VKLKSKMLLVILGSILIILGGLLTYTGSTNQKNAVDTATSLATASGEKIALSVKNEIEIAADAARTLADSLKAMKRSNSTSRDAVNEILRAVLENNPKFLDTWILWEPNAFDGLDASFANKQGHDPTGRFNTYWVNSGSKFTMSFNEGYDKPGLGDFYLLPKGSGKETLLDPYMYKLDNVDTLMAGLVVPIMIDNKFVGAIGIDFKLEALQAMMEKFTLYDTGNASIYSNNGSIVTSDIKELMGKKMNEASQDGAVPVIMKSIKEGRVYESRNNGLYKVFTPVTIGRTDTPWSVGITIPMKEITAKSTQMLYSTIAAGIFAMILLAAVIYWITQATVRPIITTVKLGEFMAQGDFTKDIPVVYTARKDEIGSLSRVFQSITDGMREMIGQVSMSTSQVAAASQQISASADQLSSGSNTQAESAQNINELFKELSTGINSVARSAEEASELSNKTTKIAVEGGKVIQQSIDGMTLVNQQMSKLEQDSNKIGEIIEVIDEIAEQTNLLALNAAIEAARAGEQGRGFAVVADEVRKLAERSSDATKQISIIIHGMQVNTEQSVKAVEGGVLSSQKTGEAFASIISMVNESANKVMEIAAACEEQAAQSSEVLFSIESISAATQESAASSEETASTAQSLAHLAESLNNSIAIFKIK